MPNAAFFYFIFYFYFLGYHPKLTSYYSLLPKLLENMFCILNYDHCYILHLDVKFAVNLDENSKFMV